MFPRPRQIARRLLRRVVRPLVERRAEVLVEAAELREDVERLEVQLERLTALVAELGERAGGEPS